MVARATCDVIPDCDVATNTPTAEHGEAAAASCERNSWGIRGAVRLSEVASAAFSRASGVTHRAHNVVEGVGEVCFVILDVGMATIFGGRGVRALVLGCGCDR